MARWVAYHLPKSVLYWGVIRVWAYFTTQVFPDRHPEDTTIFDVLKGFNEWQ